MKKACFYFVIVKLLLLTNASYGQQFTTVKTINVEVSKDTLKNLLNLPPNKNGIKPLVSAPTLNSFFATKISTYLSEASDLSLSKAYAVLDDSDGRLFLGGTFKKKVKYRRMPETIIY